MMKKFSLTILICLTAGISHAQILKGIVTNQAGQPIPYATVYIRELRQGTTSNPKGEYEVKLPEGRYTITYESLGYQPSVFSITLADQAVTKNVTLMTQYYQIPEVRVSATGEDPAYAIMRKAIGMAPYYLNQVNYYKAEVYLKGNLVINRIPRLIQKSMKMDAKRSSASVSAGQGSKGQTIKAGDSFFMESYNEIEFTAPDKYFQKVLSLNSTFPDEGNEISPMSFIEASFYQPQIADLAISPLAPNAFSHYRFRYDGAYNEGKYTINKIQVIPKRKSQQLFEGTIYIVENLWCLQSVDLVNENLAGKVRVKQIYIPVQDDIWMPVSHSFDINISIIGFKADASYGSSVKYLEVKPNAALQKPKGVTTDYYSHLKQPKDSIPENKTGKEINKILSKDNLSNRDMMKLSKLMGKKSKESQPDSVKNSLEIKDKTVQVVEQGAKKKDSAYWAQIRPIPLSETEKKSIRVSDSTKRAASLSKQKSDTVPAIQKTKKHPFLDGIKHVGLGYTWSDTTGLSLRFGGLINPGEFSFNTVDGFDYGTDMNLTKDWKGRTLSITPVGRWAFSRKSLLWTVSSYYRFNPYNKNQLYFRFGQTSIDINRTGGINLFLNTDFTLLLRKNNLKLYQSGYSTFGYSGKLANGLNLDVSVTYEGRKVLHNTTSFSLFGKSPAYTENVPVNPYLSPGAYPFYAMRDMNHADLMTIIDYTPFTRYKIVKGRKIPQGSDWPTFTLTWEHGLNQFSELTPGLRNFDMLRFDIARKKDLGAFSELNWRLRSGGFINNRYITFYDFYQVNSQSLPLLLNSYDNAFMLPAYYSLATPEFYVEGHLKYTAPYLLLKLLPFLSNSLIRENLSYSSLYTRYHNEYTELGYSLSEVFLVFELGVYAGFENLHYKSAGAVLVMKFH